MARLQLPDGKNHYGGCNIKLLQYFKYNIDLGFVVDVFVLEYLHADVYAIVRINKLTILKHSQKLVKNIFQIKLLFIFFQICFTNR
jgi:hypothetical protein